VSECRAAGCSSLTDHGVLASIGSVGDALDNALTDSFIDSFKTELVADSVWRSRSGWSSRSRMGRLVQRAIPNDQDL
jgi:hypothetical protein